MQNLLHQQLEMELNLPAPTKLFNSGASDFTSCSGQAMRVAILSDHLSKDKELAELLRILAAKVDPVD